MKRIFTLLTVVVWASVIACVKDSAIPTDMPAPPPIPPVTDTTSVIGNFVNGAHTTSGTATITAENGSKKLLLENFRTDAGPDLYIYLSNNTAAGSFISLGKLKSTTGNQEYAINGMPDLNQYRYVLVWCQQFGVLFGSARIR